MSYHYSIPLVSDEELAQSRTILGTELARVLGYFREDGARSIVQIEEAFEQKNPAKMVIPAHTLKGESRQFGARRLGDIAEIIENAARRCVELHSEPNEVAGEVAMLRACFTETLAILADVVPTVPVPHVQPISRLSPLIQAPRVFGRRPAN